MIVSIHQPQFLPYIGFFNKVINSDLYIVLDDVRGYQRDFTNRNRIKTNNGILMISIPVGREQKDKCVINEIVLPEGKKWMNSILGTFQSHYGRAPYFDDFYPGLSDVFLKKEYTKLIDLDMELLKYVFSYLEYNIDIRFASEFNVDSTRTQSNIDLTKKVGGDSYLSGIGGRAYMDNDLFIKEQIHLYFQDFTHPRYRQLWGDFIENLSVVDLIFNEGKNSAEIIKSSGKIIKEV